MHAKCWSGNLKGIDNSEGLGADGEIILEWMWIFAPKREEDGS
jgi:hypothetical protein